MGYRVEPLRVQEIFDEIAVAAQRPARVLQTSRLDAATRGVDELVRRVPRHVEPDAPGLLGAFVDLLLHVECGDGAGQGKDLDLVRPEGDGPADDPRKVVSEAYPSTSRILLEIVV